jgi:hypothetical protein
MRNEWMRRHRYRRNAQNATCNVQLQHAATQQQRHPSIHSKIPRDFGLGAERDCARRVRPQEIRVRAGHGTGPPHSHLAPFPPSPVPTWVRPQGFRVRAGHGTGPPHSHLAPFPLSPVPTWARAPGLAKRRPWHWAAHASCCIRRGAGGPARQHGADGESRERDRILRGERPAQRRLLVKSKVGDVQADRERHLSVRRSKRLPTSAPGLGSLRPHLHRDWARL